MMTDGGAAITVGGPNTAWYTHIQPYTEGKVVDSKSQDEL